MTQIQFTKQRKYPKMNPIEHHIQKSILKYLTNKKAARYSEMKPENIDSNLYAYHLKKLLKLDFIIKESNLYTLSPHGQNYVENISLSEFNFRNQPKITTRILLKNKKGQYFLTKRSKQPLIDMWGFASGKTHIEDERIIDAAQREVSDKIGLNIRSLKHVGNYYAKILSQGEIVSNTLSHVFSATLSELETHSLKISNSQNWFSTDEMTELDLIPDTLDLIYLAEHSSGDFFAELEYEI